MYYKWGDYLENKLKKIFVASSSKARPLAEKAVGILEELNKPYEVEVVPWWKFGVFVTGAITLHEVLRAVKECDAGIFVISEDDCITESGNKNDGTYKTEPKTYIVSENVLIESGIYKIREA